MGAQLMRRRRFVADLMDRIPDALVVTGLGSPSYDVHAAGARPATFHLWGAMGAAVPLSLGLALARPERPVVALTSDGEHLMNIGSLAAVAAAAPPNLTVVVLDNGHYGETGMQPSHTSLGTDLVAVASGFGIRTVIRATDLSAVAEVVGRIHAGHGTTYVHALIDPEQPPRALPPRDGVANKNAFRAALGYPSF
jgi:thiamine pyrophosphate-dependent acetolactate synthase large subunit-like protein